MTKRRRGSYVLEQQERDGQSAIRQACWSLTFALRMREGVDAEVSVQHVREALAAAMVELEKLPPRIHPSQEMVEQQRRYRDEALAGEAMDLESCQLASGSNEKGTLLPPCVSTSDAGVISSSITEEQP